MIAGLTRHPCFLLFIVAPVAGLVGAGGVAGLGQLGTDVELRDSLILTAVCATTATLLGVVGGTPLAYLLARRRFTGEVGRRRDRRSPARGFRIRSLGLRCCSCWGARVPLDTPSRLAGLRVVGSPLGIICAMLFVSAPLYVGGAREAFARVDVRYESVARTLGDSAWRAVRRVTLPLASRGLVAASITMWARAISEFGAIVILTYTPKAASVLTYDRFVSYGLSQAIPAAAVLVLLSLVPLIALRALSSSES